MTGEQWNNYFINDNPLHRERILEALETLASDSTFTQQFGNTFKELASICRYPLTKRGLKQCLE